MGNVSKLVSRGKKLDFHRITLKSINISGFLWSFLKIKFFSFQDKFFQNDFKKCLFTKCFQKKFNDSHEKIWHFLHKFLENLSKNCLILVLKFYTAEELFSKFDYFHEFLRNFENLSKIVEKFFNSCNDNFTL